MNLVTWRKDDIIISSDDPLFSQTMMLINRTTATTQLILSSGNISNFVGTFTCEITDGNGRITSSDLQTNGMI